jgi:hypothetical protein
LISTDGGNTWNPGAQLGLYGNNDQILAIAPGSPFTLYLTSPSGVQRSTDGGKTVSVVLATVQTSSALIAVDPKNLSTVYIADFDVLYRSTNGGQTWSQVALPSEVAPQYLFVSPADSRVFVAAYTESTVFVTKWSPDGSQVLYSTYFGGSGGDGASGIAVDGTGNAYVTGSTSSTDFPTTSTAFQTKLTGPPNVFVSKLSADGSQLIYSTLLGTPSTLPAYSSLLGTQRPGSYGIAVDNAGEAVITGFTAGNFPVTANAFQTAPVAGCYMSQFASLFDLARGELRHLWFGRRSGCERKRLGRGRNSFSRFSGHAGCFAAEIRRRLLRWLFSPLQCVRRTRLCHLSGRFGV